MKEKHGKERATFYTDSFAFGLIGTLSGLEKEVLALNRELEACTKGQCRPAGRSGGCGGEGGTCRGQAPTRAPST